MRVVVEVRGNWVIPRVVDYRGHGQGKGGLLLLAECPELSRGAVLNHLDETGRVCSLVVPYSFDVSGEAAML